MKNKNALKTKWERGLKEKMDKINKKSDWKTAKADYSDHELKIFDQAVMEDWETPYMKELARISTLKGGTVLELGFGMGISAGFIQRHNIKKHIIIEANKEVAKKARQFAKKAKYKTEILEGFWEEVIDKIPDESIDGILFDTFPLTEKEFDKIHFIFFPFAYRKLKSGGIFTYYSDEVNNFSRTHLKKLQEAGFKLKNIKKAIVRVNPPRNCEYWKAKTMISPIIVK
ncbi:MAG: class I SAM-dependent methyltransferase [Deltaproteobacteria bacterium]|nr:class I SAM-dependent methyltransferase [Deltaproteobacteria bacterium]